MSKEANTLEAKIEKQYVIQLSEESLRNLIREIVQEEVARSVPVYPPYPVYPAYPPYPYPPIIYSTHTTIMDTKSGQGIIGKTEDNKPVF